MISFPPLAQAWLRGLLRPAVIAWLGLVGVGLLCLVSQMIVRLPVVPSLAGVGTVGLGLLPEMAALMLPVALFFATVSLARRWSEGGDLAAVYASGFGARSLVPVLLLVGLTGGAVTGVLSHQVAPMGREMAREAIANAGSTLRLAAGRPVWMGDTLVMAEQSSAGVLRGVLVAQGDVIATAPLAKIAGDGVVQMESGQARGLGLEPWSMAFERMRIPVRIPPPRVHSFDLSGGRLASLIARMEAQGRSAHAEQLVLFKRTTLGLGTPLLVLLAFPLGASRRWAIPGAVGTVLGVWGVQRLADHMAATWGAVPSAVLPLLVLMGVTVMVWRGWRSR